MLEGSTSRIFDGLQAIGVRGEFDLAPFSLLIVEPAVVETKFPWAPISIGGAPDQIAEGFEQFRLAGLEYAISVVTDLVATVIPTERSDEEYLLGEAEIPLPSGHRNDNS